MLLLAYCCQSVIVRYSSCTSTNIRISMSSRIQRGNWRQTWLPGVSYVLYEYANEFNVQYEYSTGTSTMISNSRLTGKVFKRDMRQSRIFESEVEFRGAF